MSHAVCPTCGNSLPEGQPACPRCAQNSPANILGMKGALNGEAFGLTPSQQARLTSLLAEVVGEESEPAAKPVRLAPPPHQLYRLLIALILLLAITAGFALPRQLKPLTQPARGAPAPEGAQQLAALVQALPRDARVLLAVEYEPAQKPEMDMAFAPVFAQLQQQNSQIQAVTTRPLGTFLAREWLANPPAGDTGTLPALTFLPGGFFSIRSLVEPAASPTATPQLVDFNLVLILAGDFETARTWIEQLSLSPRHPPLAVVSSAQSGPLLLPWLESGTIAGLITGPQEGAAYAQHAAIQTPTQVFLPAVRLGNAIAWLLILAGVLLSLRPNRPRRRRSRKQGV